MILYFPVSALVTLFGNILQNPVDPRAKSDTRLMNTVVTFLSMLGQEAEQGGVHRMLGICSEFERIAKAVIEKAEKEQSSRRKRKTQDTSSRPPASYTTASSTTTPPSNFSAAQTPRAANAMSTTPPGTVGDKNNHMSPSQRPDRGSPFSIPGSVNDGSPPNWPQEFGVPPSGNGDYDSFHFGPDMHSPPVPHQGMFQQPVLPHDLFSLPMNLDFTFAEMSGGAYPTVENGNFNNDHLMGVHPQ